VEGIDETAYRAAYRVCSACMALEYQRAAMVEADKQLRERGINPEAWRMWHAELTPKARELIAAQHADH
jgi:hypothetical protein